MQSIPGSDFRNKGVARESIDRHAIPRFGIPPSDRRPGPVPGVRRNQGAGRGTASSRSPLRVAHAPSLQNAIGCSAQAILVQAVPSHRSAGT
jgi:hypothetical protein